MSDSASVPVTAKLPRTILDKLEKLARKRGVTANTVLEQAILNESYFDQETEKGGAVLLQKRDRSIVRLDLKK